MPINVGDIVLLPVNPEEEKWNTLVDQIIAGNVIPVIGSDIILDDCDINQFVINLLIKQYSINEKCISFSELIYNPRFPKELRDSIYVWLDAFCSQNKNIRHSKLLERILSIKQFPFVITTSFFPIVENAMKKIWGENNVKTLIFDNNPTTTIKPGIGVLFIGCWRKYAETYVGYTFFTFLVPLFPTGCYRYRIVKSEVNSITYNIYGSEKWSGKELFCIYTYFYGGIVWFMSLFMQIIFNI